MATYFDHFRAQRIERRNMNDYRVYSEQLDAALRGDFAWLDVVVRDLFPETPEVQAQPFNLVRRVADMFSRLYRQPVQRFFRSETNAAVDYGKLREIYERSDINGALLSCHRRLVPQQSQVGLVLPDKARRVRVRTFSPWQVDVVPANTIYGDDIEHAAEVRFLVELDREVLGGVVTSRYGWIVLTPDEAYIESASGQRSSLYNPGTDDLSHPFGEIPAFKIATEEAMSGWSLPPVDEPLRAIAIALAARTGDLSHILHYQGYGQPVVEPTSPEFDGMPQGSAEGLTLGPNRVLFLRNGQFRIVTPQAQVGEYRSFIEALLRWYALTRGVDQDQFLKAATARTAVSRRFDRADRAEERANYVTLFTELETKLARLVCKVANHTGLVTLPEDVIVDVRYYEPPDRLDPLVEAQARALEYELGERSRADYIQKRDNVPRAVALERVARNLAEAAAIEQLAKAPAIELSALAEMPRRADEVLQRLQQAGSIDRMNGAQVTAAVTAAQAVADGLLTEAGAATLLSQAFGLPDDTSREIVKRGNS